MYKKRFRRWNFVTRRKGWQTRPNGIPAPPAAPNDLRMAEFSLSSIHDDLREQLHINIPTAFHPFNLAETPKTMRPRAPETHLLAGDFLMNFLGALDLIANRGRPSTVGAFFEKAFVGVEDMVRSRSCLLLPDLMYILAETFSLKQSKARELVLKQLHGFARRIHGPNDVLTLWTGSLLKKTEAAQKELATVFSTAVYDISIRERGRYAGTTLYGRMRNLAVKSIIGGVPYHDEWNALIKDCRDSPDSTEAVVRETTNHYGLMLLYRYHDPLGAMRLCEDSMHRLRDITDEEAQNIPSLLAWFM